MSEPIPALSLPTVEWEAWLSAHCEDQLAQARRLREELSRSAGRPAEEVLDRWNDLTLALRNVAAVASLFANVHPDEAVRDAGDRGEQQAADLETEIGQDRGLFEVLAGLDVGAPDEQAQRVHRLSLRDFRRAGVDQDDEVRTRLRELARRELVVGQEFDRAVRDDVRSVSVPPSALAGLPEDYRLTHEPGEDGLVTLTTDYPDYLPFMTFGRDRQARADLLRAFANRGWPGNDARLRELLELRRERAGLLGYADWPSFDAEVKMIGSGTAIDAFVDRIADLAAERGRRDVGDLLDRIRVDHPQVDSVSRVDSAFYTEVLSRERFGVDAQQVRAYFDFATVRAGLLAVTGRLFDVDYVEVPDAATWHADVTTYDVLRGGKRLGRIHLDLHPRAGKYGHAAQFELVPGVRGRQLPEGVLVCNFSRGLMEHAHVVTLFHEFGHLVHHVLGGDQRWARFSGVATEWDFVEAPSQMLEEWAWDPDVLGSFAVDADGTPIPAELVARMRAADEFGQGLWARTQMFYAALSYVFHRDVPADLTATMVALQERYDLLAYVPGTHFFASFGHLNGYGSGYYTYMWSLVIAKDLFSAFDGADLFAPEVAHRYRDRVLARGGSADAAELVADFLGRPSSFDAFEAWLSSGQDGSPGVAHSGLGAQPPRR